MSAMAWEEMLATMSGQSMHWKLKMWAAYHKTSIRALGREIGVSHGVIIDVAKGRKSSAPTLAKIKARTGIGPEAEP